MNVKSMYSFLNSDINLIEKELENTIQADHPVLREASVHLLKAGGKRIRPVFVLLSGHFGNYDIRALSKVAVSLELIHMASLVHDDVIDDAELRRGEPTIKAKWDNLIAMYAGDYIFARALETVTMIDNKSVHKILSKTMVELSIGEIEQIKDQFNWEQNLRVYLRRIKRKTALLIAASCQLGAIASDAAPYVQRSLYYFGYNVGMAFQITDDILDFTGTEKQLGKPAGGDLRNGNITLPVLYAMRDHRLKEDITKITSHSSSSEVDHVLNLIRHSGGLEYSKEIADRYLNKAFAILKELPANKANKALYNIAKFIGKRKF